MGRMASCIGLCSERRSHSPLRQKTRCAIKEKAVYSKPPTPYHRPVSLRAKMAPIRYSPYAISTNPASLKAREKSHRSDLVFESLTHRKTVTKSNKPFCVICTMGSNVASFAKSCLSCMPTPSFRRLRDDSRSARQSLPNLETTPSADLSSRRFHSLCTS